MSTPYARPARAARPQLLNVDGPNSRIDELSPHRWTPVPAT
jgi:hypothetical protein